MYFLDEADEIPIVEKFGVVMAASVATLEESGADGQS
jgi:hypothetical protein